MRFAHRIVPPTRPRAARLRVVKLKGTLSHSDVAAFAPQLRHALAANGGALVELVAKGATFGPGAALALAEVLRAGLPPSASLLPAKKGERTAASATHLPVDAYAALFNTAATEDGSAEGSAALVPSGAALKLKVKLGRGVALLLDETRLRSVAGGATIIHDVAVAPVDQLKSRGPLTLQCARALGAALAALPEVATVKFARYWLVPSEGAGDGDGDDACGVLAGALVAAAATRPSLRLALKCKGKGKADVVVGGAGAASVEDVAALLRSIAAEPPSKGGAGTND